MNSLQALEKILIQAQQLETNIRHLLTEIKVLVKDKKVE